MVRRWWKWMLLVAVALPLLAWGCDRAQTIDWVGRTDLEVEFLATDAATGHPISGASVEVQSEGGLYEDGDRQEFVLAADSGGVARKECRNSMCFGTHSGLGFTDTFTVHLPWWRFRVVAEGYTGSKWTELDVPQYIRQARRAGAGRAELIVPVALQKAWAERGAAADRGRHDD
jgi:hypothetical protein